MHIQLAHEIWKRKLKKGAYVIDATCGNGHDSLFIAKNLPEGRLDCYDIQNEAISATKKRLEGYSNVNFFLKSHIDIEAVKLVDLFVYNLGYLPGGDKGLTTLSDVTLASIKKNKEILAPNGLLSITLYPGHPEGRIEQEILIHYATSLDSKDYVVSHTKRLGSPLAPSLLIIERR